MSETASTTDATTETNTEITAQDDKTKEPKDKQKDGPDPYCCTPPGGGGGGPDTDI